MELNDLLANFNEKLEQVILRRRESSVLRNNPSKLELFCQLLLDLLKKIVVHPKTLDEKLEGILALVLLKKRSGDAN